MENFLTQLNLSEEAINVYLESLNHPFLTYSDLQAIVPNVEEVDFTNIIDNLLELDLILKIVPEKGEILTRYYSIPPITNIITYFQNIEQNFSTIQENIQKLIIQSVNNIFQQKSEINLNDVQTQTQEIFQDFKDRTLLERKDAEDITENFEVVRGVDNQYLDLQNNIIKITQAKIGTLIKTLSGLKNDIIEEVRRYIPTGVEESSAIINIIKKNFKREIDNITETFLDSILDDFREEFEKISFTPIINQVLESKKEYNTLLMDLINNFEKNFEELSHIIEEKSKTFKPHLEELKEQIIYKTNQIIQNSIQQIVDLNKPPQDVISDCRQLIYAQENLVMNDIWVLNSINQMKEELLFAIKNTKNDLLIIIPQLKGYISDDLLKDLPEQPEIFIASSDHFVNSKVKEIADMEKVSFKQYNKTNFIGIRSDKNFIALGIIDKSKDDPLDNVIGFGTNNQMILKSLTNRLNKIWSSAKQDTGALKTEKPVEKPLKRPSVKKVSPPKPRKQKGIEGGAFSSVSDRIKDIESRGQKEPQPSSDIKPPEVRNRKKESVETSPGGIEDFVSNIAPSEDDEVGNLINDAFNDLLEKLNELTENQFGQELENVADVILENKGFTVSLHHIRRFARKFNQDTPLTQEEKSEIFENIEEWKQKLF